MSRRTPEQKADRNAKVRERYASDPEFRARCRANQLKNERKYEAANKARRSVLRKRLYAENNGLLKATAWRKKNPEKVASAWRARRVNTPWKNLLFEAKSRAIKRGFEFSLTSEWAQTRYTGSCEVTGIRFDTSPGRKGPSPSSPSIDRIDNSLGYTGSNCRFILFCINAFRGPMGDKEMVSVAEAIVKGLGKESEHLHAA